MSYIAMLNQRCTIERPSPSATDAWGRPTGAYVTVAANVPCRLAMERGREVARAQSELTTKSDRLYLPLETDVAERDRVVLEGVTYDVVFVGRSYGRHSYVVQWADLEVVR